MSHHLDCTHCEESKTFKIVRFSIVLFLGILVMLPVLAPILSYFGLNKPANAIYKIYSFFCHQKAHRSIFIYDEQCAWCTRDTFIWTTIFISAITILYSSPIKGLNWKIAISLAIPMALDGGIQFIGTLMSIINKSVPIYESTNTMRALTGTLFGLGVAFFFLPRLRSELQNIRNKSIINKQMRE